MMKIWSLPYAMSMSSSLSSSEDIETPLLCFYQMSLLVLDESGNANMRDFICKSASIRITKATGIGGSICLMRTSSQRPSHWHHEIASGTLFSLTLGEYLKPGCPG